MELREECDGELINEKSLWNPAMVSAIKCLRHGGCMPVTSAFGRWSQEDGEFKVSLSYLAS